MNGGCRAGVHVGVVYGYGNRSKKTNSTGEGKRRFNRRRCGWYTAILKREHRGWLNWSLSYFQIYWDWISNIPYPISNIVSMNRFLVSRSFTCFCLKGTLLKWHNLHHCAVWFTCDRCFTWWNQQYRNISELRTESLHQNGDVLGEH